MAAIGAGKHVHFNKTMATTAKECDDLISAAARKGVRLVASPGQMLRPALQRLRRLVADGSLGKLIWAAASCPVSHYHTQEKVRLPTGPVGEIDPSWYYRKPAGGPVYDVTVYALHSLTGLVGPALRVCGLSGLAVAEREFNGRKIACDMDDNTAMLLDFGNAFFAFASGTVVGNVTKGQHTPTVFGTGGTIAGTVFTPNKAMGGNLTFGEPGEPRDMQREGDHQPHAVGEHAKMKESHVFEDMMQLVDWVRDGKPSIATAEHARHVVEIIEAGYRAAATGKTQTLRTTFSPLAASACAE
jgi:predicted dehydrogenase